MNDMSKAEQTSRTSFPDATCPQWSPSRSSAGVADILTVRSILGPGRSARPPHCGLSLDAAGTEISEHEQNTLMTDRGACGSNRPTFAQRNSVIQHLSLPQSTPLECRAGIPRVGKYLLRDQKAPQASIHPTHTGLNLVVSL